MHTAIQNYTGSFSMKRRQNSQAQLQREKLGYVLLDTLKDNNCDSNLLRDFEFWQENIKHKIKTILLSHQVKLFDTNRVTFEITSHRGSRLTQKRILIYWKSQSSRNLIKKRLNKDSKLYSEYIRNKKFIERELQRISSPQALVTVAVKLLYIDKGLYERLRVPFRYE